MQKAQDGHLVTNDMHLSLNDRMHYLCYNNIGSHSCVLIHSNPCSITWIRDTDTQQCISAVRATYLQHPPYFVFHFILCANSVLPLGVHPSIYVFSLHLSCTQGLHKKQTQPPFVPY